MEESNEEVKPVRAFSIRRFLVFLIPYGICVLFSFIGVVLGAINFAAGPVHYSGLILVLWFLMDIVALVGIILHLVYFGIEIAAEEGEPYAMTAMYALFVGLPVTWASIALLTGKHFGWFSACELAALVTCGVIDAVMISIESNKIS